MATLTATPAQADCSTFVYSGNPFDCQDPPGQGGFTGGGPIVDASQLPSQWTGGPTDMGKGLPAFTDPRFAPIWSGPIQMPPPGGWRTPRDGYGSGGYGGGGCGSPQSTVAC
jgi:hypothetical protein